MLDFMTWTQKYMFKATHVWQLTFSYPCTDPEGVGTEGQDLPLSFRPTSCGRDDTGPIV